MIILKQVIQYTTTNGLEATWVDRTVAPDTEVPEVPAIAAVPAVLDEDGEVVTPAVPEVPAVPAHTIPGVVTDVQVKCHSYDGTQMNMFRADAAAFGTPLDDYEDMIADIESKIVTYVPPPLTLVDFDRALTNHLDNVAKEHRYDNRITCALRAGYVGPFQAEGIAFASWMDTCNAMAYILLGEIQTGTRELPTSTQALIDLLPTMEWPE